MIGCGRSLLPAILNRHLPSRPKRNKEEGGLSNDSTSNVPVIATTLRGSRVHGRGWAQPRITQEVRTPVCLSALSLCYRVLGRSWKVQRLYRHLIREKQVKGSGLWGAQYSHSRQLHQPL